MKERRLKIGFVILCVLLLVGIVVGYYGTLEGRTVIDLFFVPAFIIAATLTFRAFQGKTK